MSDVILGLCTSHTPQLSTGPEIWHDHAQRDVRNPNLLGTDGEYHTYDELLAAQTRDLSDVLDPQHWEATYTTAQSRVDDMAEALKAARPDVVIIFGDDHKEMFLDDNTPTFCIFRGESIIDYPPTPEKLSTMAAGIKRSLWAAHADEPDAYPGHPEFATYLVEALVDDQFDISQFTEQPETRTLGHAFTYVRRRLLLDQATPIIPVFVNTYYPPNVPTARRAWDLGRSIAAAIRRHPGDLRVAIMGSGGLSHFVVDEDLDHRVLTALKDRNVEDLAAIPRKHFRSGNSEILNWIAAAGACEGLTMTVEDYLPGYRSPAGTGAGMCFATWRSAE